MKTMDSLCRPTDPIHRQAPVFVKSYPSEDYKLVIRPFCITTDMNVLFGWLEQQMGIQFWKEGSPRQELLQSYRDILESDHSQSLLCLLDDRPVCLLDISRAPYSEVFMYVDACPNDYSIWLIMSAYVTVRSAYVNVVQAYVEYFFSSGNVQRIITYQPAYDEWSNHLLKNAGFVYLDTKKMFSGVVNLYEYKKDNYTGDQL